MKKKNRVRKSLDTLPLFLSYLCWAEISAVQHIVRKKPDTAALPK
jgi:hypothetical protein